jgi:wyosine [tRNA(Phe)-imidazoG37] synthetase (radical SAM superfamily)
LKYSSVFGPINSRRFGRSLGVDLSPNLKQCNFDCLYCELGAEREKVDHQIDPIVSDKIFVEIEEAIQKFDEVDVLTFTANGEPTLYPDLDNLLLKVNRIKGKYRIKTLVLSNGGNIWIPEIRDTLKRFDKVKLSLDCATDECFQKIDRPLKNIDIEAIKSGIAQFSREFRGELFIEILFIGGINTKESEIKALNSALLNIQNITRIDIGTVERPPAYDVKPVSYKTLFEISQKFDKSLPIFIAKHQEAHGVKNLLSKSELLHTLKLRPLTHYDIASLFDEATNSNLQTLLAEDLIEIKYVGNIEFYQPKKSLI